MIFCYGAPVATAALAGLLRSPNRPAAGVTYRALLLTALFAFRACQCAADYTNSIGMQFNNIPAGRFYMGSCQFSATCPSGVWVDDNVDDDETPQHEVHIRRGFRMGVHEVTLGQFKQYIASCCAHTPVMLRAVAASRKACRTL